MTEQNTKQKPEWIRETFQTTEDNVLEAQEVADTLYDGNRSMLYRKAVTEFCRQHKTTPDTSNETN